MPLFMIEIHGRCVTCKTSRARAEIAVAAKSAAAAMRYVRETDEWKIDRGALDELADGPLFAVRAWRVLHPGEVRIYQATDLCWGPERFKEITVARAFFDKDLPPEPSMGARGETPTEEEEAIYDAACDEFDRAKEEKEAEFTRLQESAHTKRQKVKAG